MTLHLSGRTPAPAAPDPHGTPLVLVHLSDDGLRLSAQLADTPVCPSARRGRVLTTIPLATPWHAEALSCALVRLGLSPGADAAWVETLLAGGCVTLARGRPARPAVPGHWRLARLPLLLPRGFRRSARPVEAGDVVAVWRPAQEGSPGVTALGEPIPPPTVQRTPATYLAGEGVYVAGGCLRAADAGYVVLSSSGDGLKLSVRRLPTVAATDLPRTSTEHGVVVRGDLDSVHLECEGPVVVQGSVLGSHVATTGHDLVVTGAAVRSTLQVRAGARPRLIRAAARAAREELQALLATADTVLAEPSFSGYDLSTYGVGRLLKLLLRHPRLAGLRPAAEHLRQVAEQPWEKALAEALLDLLEPRHLAGLRTTEPLCDLLAQLRQLEARCDELAKAPTLHVGTAEHSTLEADGHVRVHGQGLYRSDVQAHSLSVPAGDVKGGHVRVSELGQCHTLGSERFIPTFLAAAEVRACYVHPGVVLELEGLQYPVLEPLHHVRFSVEHGRISLSDWQGGRRDVS